LSQNGYGSYFLYVLLDRPWQASRQPSGPHPLDAGVCKINAFFDSGAYEIGQRFGLKRVLSIPVPG